LAPSGLETVLAAEVAIRPTADSDWNSGPDPPDGAEGCVAEYLRMTGSLINYGERYRAGERISSCLAESTVNAVISKRFAKRQQMQWTPRGAHLLLQTRTRALDGTLRPLFERWYPGFGRQQRCRPHARCGLKHHTSLCSLRSALPANRSAAGRR
jgi:hypothetical protein